MKISFYYVDEEYIDYLKKREITERGFTTVPNMKYHKNDKFVYGVVLKVNEVDYYVPFSHYNKPQEDNILVKIDYHKEKRIAGSLRFNYMIPVPKRSLIPVDFSVFDENRKVMLQKEYRACLSMLSQILKRAMKTYNRVVNHVDDELSRNSCLFELLEIACKEYDRLFES